MAMQSFNGLGWFLCGAIIAPGCYLVNSHGAAQQAQLNATKAAILQAQRDIRSLETEFNTRANLAQLERWSSGDALALAPAAPQQYLAGEAALASLDQAPQVELAALNVPVTPAPAVAAPVQTAAATVAPAVERSQTAAVAAPRSKSPAQQDGELRKLMKKADRRAVAMVDRGVLSASTIDDLQKLAKREKLALR